jgi:hypothetical protein
MTARRVDMVMAMTRIYELVTAYIALCGICHLR